jgi:hypothetical protein
VLPVIAASTIQFRPRRPAGGDAEHRPLRRPWSWRSIWRPSGLRTDPWLTAYAQSLPSGSVARYTVALNVFGLFAVAMLGGSLADRLRSAGRRLATGVDRDCGPAGVEPARHRQLAERAGHHRCIAPDPDVQPRRRGDHRCPVPVGHRPRIDTVLQLSPEVMASIQNDLASKVMRRRHEFWYRAEDKRGEIEIGLTATHLETPGGRAGLLFTFQDVTAIKKLERDAAIQQRLAAVGEMAAGIAHEIRNPLASMSGSIQILRQELRLSSEQEQLMDIVLRESERLNTHDPIVPRLCAAATLSNPRFDVRRALNDTALLLRNSADVLDGARDCDRTSRRQSSGTTPTRDRSSRSSGTSRPTACARCQRAAGSAWPDRSSRHQKESCWTVSDEGIGFRPGSSMRSFNRFTARSPRAAASAWRSCTAS